MSNDRSKSLVEKYPPENEISSSLIFALNESNKNFLSAWYN